jgi:threonine aldolase
VVQVSRHQNHYFGVIGVRGVSLDSHAAIAALTIGGASAALASSDKLPAQSATTSTKSGVSTEVVPQADAEAVANAARELGVASYLDGARLWNAAVVAERSVAAPFDVAMVSLSKGLGAPGGSVVAASRDRIPALVRYRRMSGGAMRQVGIFAAAGLWALDHNVERLAEDHANAARLAESQAYVIDPATVDTNILVWQVADGAPDVPTIVERARERGVLIFALGPRTFRAVTHLDVTDEQCATAAEILVDAASE